MRFDQGKQENFSRKHENTRKLTMEFSESGE